LQRLASGEWFTSRVSACGLFTVAYPRVPAGVRTELRQLFAQLCHDETPMVRRAAAQRLGAFAGAVDRDTVNKELLPLFTDLTGDGAAGTKGAAAGPAACPAVARGLGSAARGVLQRSPRGTRMAAARG
jgi:serine/threonine-protein phosphatase 2A regulatory subunit A